MFPNVAHQSLGALLHAAGSALSEAPRSGEFPDSHETHSSRAPEVCAQVKPHRRV